MSLEHLNDDIIQAYLDGTLQEREAEVKVHLLQCSNCSEELRMYRLIYSGIEEVTTVEIPEGFAARAVNNVIPGSIVEEKESTVWSWLLGTGFATASVATLMYFTDWKKIFKLFIDGFESGYTTITTGFEQAGGSSIMSNSVVPMVIFAALLLALFGFLDNRLRNSDRKDTTLSCF